MSLVFKLTMLSFLLHQSISVLNFDDPKITSYEISESRANMVPVNVTESSLSLYVSLKSVTEGSIIVLDPKYGSLALEMGQI